MTEQFVAIIEKENEPEFISFLQALTPAQKMELTPQIKKLAKQFSEFRNPGNGVDWPLKGTDVQAQMVQTACFVCYNRVDYEKTPFSIWMLDRIRLNKVIDWYCPDWFSDFANKQAAAEALPYYLNYDWLMELTQKCVLKASRELVVKTMPPMIFEQQGRIFHYKPDNLLRYKITLEEHLWYLFELESNLHYVDRGMNFGPDASTEKIGWIPLLRKYSDEGVVNRRRLLKESLLASNRNFNKVLSGWFSQLFTELEPTTAELLELQPELFSVLAAPHSKPVNTALQTIKTIVTENDFNADNFLDTVPVLLSSGGKSTVLSSLMILEKLAQKNPRFGSRVALLACQSFVQPSEDLQAKAAKLILKTGDSSNEALRHEIQAFQAGMLTTVSQALSNFFDHSESPVPTDEPVSAAAELLPIPIPENIDDLIFLASQAFDNNEPWHWDVLPAALVQFRSRLKSEDLPLLAPAFQRAFSLIHHHFTATTGYLDQLLAMFFIDVGRWLIAHFPSGNESILKVYRKHDSFLAVPEQGSYTALWFSHHDMQFYQPHKQLLLSVLEKIRQNDDLPVLSTPTHAPCWIVAEVLIERLRRYQLAAQHPNEMDLQVALCRVFAKDNTIALKQSKEQLEGELRDLVNFVLDEKSGAGAPVHFKAAWAVANSLRNYGRPLQWQIKVDIYTATEYDRRLNKPVEVRFTRRALSVYNDITTTEKSTDAPHTLYDILYSKLVYISVVHNDAKRILSLIPNNPDPFLADVINKSLQYAQFWEEGDRQMVTAVIQFLHTAWKKPGEMAYLFLGACLMSADKTIANIAGEIWLAAVTAGTLNNVELGRVIGKLECVEFAPLKRLTDLMSQNLFRVSNRHNQQLQVLIENILPHLPDEPVKNLKKLMEIYRELIIINNAAVDKALENKLTVWSGNSTLKNLIKQLERN